MAAALAACAVSPTDTEPGSAFERARPRLVEARAAAVGTGGHVAAEMRGKRKRSHDATPPPVVDRAAVGNVQYPYAHGSKRLWCFAQSSDKTDGDFKCVDCGGPMTLRKGETRRPHFAHVAEFDRSSCESVGKGEGARHKAAKEWLNANFPRCVFIRECDSCNGHARKIDASREYDVYDSKVECRIQTTEYVADVGVVRRDASPPHVVAALEVRDTHAVEAEKRGVLEALLGVQHLHEFNAVDIEKLWRGSAHETYDLVDVRNETCEACQREARLAEERRVTIERERAAERRRKAEEDAANRELERAAGYMTCGGQCGAWLPPTQFTDGAVCDACRAAHALREEQESAGYKTCNTCMRWLPPCEYKGRWAPTCSTCFRAKGRLKRPCLHCGVREYKEDMNERPRREDDETKGRKYPTVFICSHCHTMHETCGGCGGSKPRKYDTCWRCSEARRKKMRPTAHDLVCGAKAVTNLASADGRFSDSHHPAFEHLMRLLDGRRSDLLEDHDGDNDDQE